MDPDCIGIIRVPLALLSFNPPTVLDTKESQNWRMQEQLLRLDLEKIKSLSRSFRLGRCRPSRPEHQMRGAVTPDVLEVILKSAKTSKEDLFQSSCVGNFPYVSGNFTIWCFQGRRRAIAAKLAFKGRAWWTVRIYCKASGISSIVSSIDDIESLCDDASDGTIYRQVRIGFNKGNNEEVRRCILKLSTPKRKNLFQLLRHSAVSEAFDSLWTLTGLWDGMQLGNMHKHLALRCDPQLITYIQHIRQIWKKVFQGYEQLEPLLDIETVRGLQFKAPGVCKQDQEYFIRSMDRGDLFHLITDETPRQALKQNVLSIRCIIPSISTFHENMKYFSIAAHILQKHVEVVKYVEDTTVRKRKKRMDLIASICSDWKRPKISYIEIREGVFHPIQLFMTPELAFMGLFLSAQRNFVRLGSHAPLQDKQAGKLVAFEDNNYINRLCKLARKVGFMNEKLARSEASATNEPSKQSWGTGPQPITTSSVIKARAAAYWRGGKPFTINYRELQEKLYLPALHGHYAGDFLINTMFVQCDFIQSFFGYVPIPRLDLSQRPGVTLTPERSWRHSSSRNSRIEGKSRLPGRPLGVRPIRTGSSRPSLRVSRTNQQETGSTSQEQQGDTDGDIMIPDVDESEVSINQQAIISRVTTTRDRSPSETSLSTNTTNLVDPREQSPYMAPVPTRNNRAQVPTFTFSASQEQSSKSFQQETTENYIFTSNTPLKPIQEEVTASNPLIMTPIPPRANRKSPILSKRSRETEYEAFIRSGESKDIEPTSKRPRMHDSGPVKDIRDVGLNRSDINTPDTLQDSEMVHTISPTERGETTDVQFVPDTTPIVQSSQLDITVPPRGASRSVPRLLTNLDPNTSALQSQDPSRRKGGVFDMVQRELRMPEQSSSNDVLPNTDDMRINPQSIDTSVDLLSDTDESEQL